MQEKPIEVVLNDNSSILMELPGVVGIGQGEYNGDPCIKLFMAKKSPELPKQLPEFLGGYRVIVEETGEFRALGE